MSTPVLIYLARDGCPHCEHFQSEWQELKRRLNGKVRFVSFRLKKDQKLPPAIEAYGLWFPTIILAAGKQYNRFFTDTDQIVNTTGTLPALRFNAVEENGKIQPAGRPATADTISFWIKQSLPKLQ